MSTSWWRPQALHIYDLVRTSEVVEEWVLGLSGAVSVPGPGLRQKLCVAKAST